MAKKGILKFKSLKEHVYDYFREQLEKGKILPGSAVNMEDTSIKLGVSKTPLRDALLQLEMENFITIIPRRGVIVNVLSLQDIKNYYEIIGALESAALHSAFERIKNSEIKYMEKQIEGMKKAIKNDNFDLYYEKNLKFHNTYLNLCKNENLAKIVNNLKKRLYDFPRQEGFVKEWEEASNNEHKELVNLIKGGKVEEAISYIRDVHWSFKVQEKYINKYYKKALQFQREILNK